MCDGIHGMLPRERMCPSARKRRDAYSITPNADLMQTEFGFYVLDRWRSEGKLPDRHQAQGEDEYLANLFGYEERGDYILHGLGWCEAEFDPPFEVRVIEDRGEYELVQDVAGRSVLYFKGRRNGFMPSYVDHPVKDMASWRALCKGRLQPSEGRRSARDATIAEAIVAAKQGKMISQRLIGGYMYLRSLMGPEELLYKFYDEPELVHDCMETWLALAEDVIAYTQKSVTLDELFIAEDICYNTGPLISPAMISEFLFPYYRRLLEGIKARQLDPDRHLYFQVDTDGKAEAVIDLYMELGMDAMSPFEVASGSDVVAIGRKYPKLVIFGGIDKRVLAGTRAEIEGLLQRILPAMRQRGGYIPTCDHGVPEEVAFENYLYYRQRSLALAKGEAE